jgi:hypothetical protein
MKTIVRSHQILVHAPLQATFDYVSDLTRRPEWSGGQLMIEAVATSLVEIGKKYVSHYEPPHILGFVASDPGFGDVTHEFKIIKAPDGCSYRRGWKDNMPLYYDH